MQHIAAGSAGGLLGSEPPLSPETIGRPPSLFEAPVKLRPLEELIARKPAPVAEAPVEAPEALPETRLVVRLLDGGELEVGLYAEREVALSRAKELVAMLAAAEAAGEWPQVDGRFLRPGSIVSVDVLVADA